MTTELNPRGRFFCGTAGQPQLFIKERANPMRKHQTRVTFSYILEVISGFLEWIEIYYAKDGWVPTASFVTRFSAVPEQGELYSETTGWMGKPMSPFTGDFNETESLS